MVKIFIRTVERQETFEFKKMNEGMLAMLQLAIMLAAVSKDVVIAIMDEASWQKIVGEKT